MRYLGKIVFAILLTACSVRVSGQDIVEKLNLTEAMTQKRVAVLSKKLNISEAAAAELIIALDQSTKNANKVYNDTLIKGEEKTKRLKTILDQRNLKVKQLVGDQSRAKLLLQSEDPNLDRIKTDKKPKQP